MNRYPWYSVARCRRTHARKQPVQQWVPHYVSSDLALLYPGECHDIRVLLRQSFAGDVLTIDSPRVDDLDIDELRLGNYLLFDGIVPANMFRAPGATIHMPQGDAGEEIRATIRNSGMHTTSVRFIITGKRLL